MIFVDTSFWVGLTMPRDRRHPAARALFGRWSGEALLTSSLVRGETWTLLCRRAGHGAATACLDLLDASARLRTVHIDRDVDVEAWAWLRRHDERTYSYVDATSFVVMRSLRVREALAFDGDFAAAGFVELQP